MDKWQQNKGFNKFLIFVLLLSIFCTGCSNNKSKDVTIISKKPCIVEIKETNTTIYKQPQYASTIDKNGFLVEDTQKGKVKEDSIFTYFKDYLKNEKWVEQESLDNKTPYLKTIYTGKNIYSQTIKAFAIRMTSSIYSDVKGVRYKNAYPKAEILFGGWKTKNLLTQYSVSLLTNNKNGSLIKKNNYINGINCDLYSYGPDKSCNNHHCTYHKAEVCYNKEYDIALNIKIISKTDISDKYYNVDKSINELTVTKLEFTDIPNSTFTKPKALILPDYLLNKLVGTNKQ